MDANFFEATRISADTPWKVLIADDEPEVHEVTRLVLGSFRFEERPLTFLSAYSAAEAFELIQSQPDIAVLLLDVVMETEHAGLEIVRRIRQELGNHCVRIVLRTGQPGQAPEQDVISSYDINDYKEKTELTAARFQTTLFVALRSYRDLMTIESSKQGLEQVIDASADIFFAARKCQFFRNGAQTFVASFPRRWHYIVMPHQSLHDVATSLSDCLGNLTACGSCRSRCRTSPAAIPHGITRCRFA